MDAEGTMSLRRGLGRPRRQGSGSPAERRRRTYVTSEDSPASSPATNSPVADVDMSQVDSPGPSTRSSQRKISSESKVSIDSRRDSSESRVSNMSEVDMKYGNEGDEMEPSLKASSSARKEKVELQDEELEDDEGALTEYEKKPTSYEPSCALCCCGEKSLLGQGDLLKFEPTPGFNPFKRTQPKAKKMFTEDTLYNPHKRTSLTFTIRRSRNQGKQRERSRSPRRVTNAEYTASPLEVTPVNQSAEVYHVGHKEEPEIIAVIDPSGHSTAHHCCAAWSDNVCQNENFQLLNVDKAIFSGISQRCSYCARFGATISCAEPGCSRIYHYPCAASSGSFQGIKSLVLFCPEHLELTEDRVVEEELECVICDEPGNLAESLFCTSCGQHYHATCLDPPVATTPIVRAGWQCPNCKICQTCRQPGDDNKMLVCDICDKGYHTFCLSPAMTTIPKNGWKCTNCRRCLECGEDSTGNNSTGRWHHNYTVCDVCYQQRNKTSTCPICRKTLRHLSSKSTLVCSSCQRHVHTDCEDEELVSNYHQLKTTAGHSATTYQCPDCRQNRQYSGLEMETQTVDTDGSADTKSPAYSRSPRSLTPVQDDSLQSSQDFPFSASSLCEDSVSSADTDTNSIEEKLEKKEEPLPSPSFQTFSTRRHAGGGKPLDKMSLLVKYSSKKHSKRRERERNRDRSYLSLGKRKSRNSSGRRGPRPKIKNLLPPEGTAQEAHEGVVEKIPEKLKDDEDDSPMHTTIVLFPTSDTFTFSQDMCVACGSFGQGAEGRLITCSQCGQCYHPYCVSIKITKVVLSKGWRCLDCTVCEGCGKNSDEARLLLCDDCDISYHTYCLDPPLNVVPKGGWKCKWCILYVSCIKCGATTPGVNSEWTSNYTKCGPCGSLLTCPVCRTDYQDDNLICQCTHCERWLHAACDGMYTEEEVDKASSEKSYMCGQCRPFFREPSPPPPPPPPPPEPEKPPSPVIIKIPVKEPAASQHLPVPFPPSEPVKAKIHELEGVGLTESGFKQITSLALPPMPKKKKMHKSMKSGSLEILKTLANPNSDLSRISPKDMPMDLGCNLPGAPEKLQDLSFLPEVTKEKKKRRCGPKPGIGGFIVRQRKPSSKVRSTSTDSEDLRPDAALGEAVDGAEASKHSGKQDKQKRKRKTKNVSELEQKFPSYLQEAFFGKSLLDQSKDKPDSTSLSGDDSNPLQSSRHSSDKMKNSDSKTAGLAESKQQTPGQESDLGGGDDPLNFLPPAEIIDMLMGDSLEKTDPTSLEMPSVEGEEQPSQPQPQGSSEAGAQSSNPDQIEELESILNSNLVQMVPEDDLVHMDGKEVEDLLSGVLSPNEQQQQQQQQHLSGASNNLPPSSASSGGPAAASHHHPAMTGRAPHPPKPLPSLPNIIPSTKSTSQGSDVTSPAFSPDYSEPPSPWPGISSAEGGSSQDSSASQTSKSGNSSQKWEKDEQLGQLATISAVFYCNINHPRLAEEFPDWSSRLKQIRKIWRNVSPGDRQFYLQKARENRAALRIKEAQKLPPQISEDIQRKRLADQNSSMASGQRVNPQHSVVANPTVMEGQPQTPLTAGMQSTMGMQGDMVNPGQRIPQVPDRIPQSPMVQTPTGALPGSGFPMTPGAPSPAQQSIHSGGSTPVHLPERSPHVVDTVLPGPHSGIPHGMNGIPLGPTTPTMPAVIENPMQSPGMAASVPQMGAVQNPHIGGGNSGTVTPSPVQSPFPPAPPPPPPPSFSSSQENIQGIDSFPPNDTSRNIHLQQLKDWLSVRQVRKREQQGWSNEQPRPPPPPYPGNNPGQQMGQFPPGMHPPVGGNYVDPAMAGATGFPVQRPQYLVSNMNPRMMGDIASQMQAGAPGVPPNHINKHLFNAVDSRTGANIRPPGAQGQFIELRHNMTNPVHQRPRHLGLSMVNKRVNHRPGAPGNSSAGDLYDQFLHHETASGPSNQPGLFRQVSVPSHVSNPGGMVTQRRLSLPDNQVPQMVGGGRSPGSNPAAAAGILPPPVNQPSIRPTGPPSTSASNDPAGTNPDPEAQLDDLLKEGDFNLLDYAVSDVDTNKNSEENQQLFKAFGLGDDHDETQETPASSTASAGQTDQKKKEDAPSAANQQLLKDLSVENAKSETAVSSQQLETTKGTENKATQEQESKKEHLKGTHSKSAEASSKLEKSSSQNLQRNSSGEKDKEKSAGNTEHSIPGRTGSSGDEVTNKISPRASAATTEADSKKDDKDGTSGTLKIKMDNVERNVEKALSKEAKQDVEHGQMKIKLEPEEQSTSSCKQQSATQEVLLNKQVTDASIMEKVGTPTERKSATGKDNTPPKNPAPSEESDIMEAKVVKEEASGEKSSSEADTPSKEKDRKEKPGDSERKAVATASADVSKEKEELKDAETPDSSNKNLQEVAISRSNTSTSITIANQVSDMDKQKDESEKHVTSEPPLKSSQGDPQTSQDTLGMSSSEPVLQESQGGSGKPTSGTPPKMPLSVLPVSSSGSAAAATSSTPLSSDVSEASPGARQRPLLLGEQPLLLQDLLEKEKKEQEVQLCKVPPVAEGVVEPTVASDRLPFPELNEMDLKQLQEEAKLLAKDNPTMQSPPGNLTTAYYPNQEAEKVKKPPGPHARLLQAMNQQYQLNLQQQNNPKNFAMHLGAEGAPGSFQSQDGMEANPVPGPRGFPQGPRLPGPQHFPVPPQSPLQQGPMVPGMQQMCNPQQNPMMQVGVMPNNQVGTVMQMPQNAMQQRGMRPVLGNRMPGPPRMPNGVPRVRPPMMSPNSHMQNPNFPIPEGFQRMPGMPPHMAGYPYGHMADPSQFQGFDPYDGSEEPAPDKENVEEYQNWLKRRDQVVHRRVKFFEAEVGKERKKKKALAAKKRSCEKNNKTMDEKDVKELEAVTQRHGQFQKHLDNARKQLRQHSIIAQEFKMKQQQAASPVTTSSFSYPMGMRPSMLVQGLQGRRGVNQPMIGHHAMMQLGSGNFTGNQPDMDFNPQGMMPMDPRNRVHMNGQSIMMNNQMAMRHPGPHQMPRMSTTPQPNMVVQPGQVSPMMAPSQPMLPPQHSPLVHSSQGNVVLQSQQSPMMPLQSHIGPSPSPMMSPQSPMVPPQSPLGPHAVPGGMQSPLLSQNSSQRVQSPMLPHAPSPLSHLGGILPHGHRSPMTLPQGQQSPLQQRSPAIMQQGYQSPHHQMLMNHKQTSEGQKGTPFRVPSGQQSPMKSRNVVLPGHRSPMFQSVSSPAGQQSPLVALSPSTVVSQAPANPKSSNNVVLADQQSPLFSHSPSPMGMSHQSPQNAGQKSPMHPPSMSPLVQNGHQSPMQNSPAVVPNQGQQSPMRHPASPAVKDNQMSPLMQHPQMVGTPQSSNFSLTQGDSIKLGQTTPIIEPGRQTPVGTPVGMVNHPPHIAVGVENHPFSEEFEQRERIEKLRLLQEHQKQKEALIQKLQHQSMVARGHPLPPEVISQVESQMQHQAHMNIQQIIPPEQQQHRRHEMQASSLGMQFLSQGESAHPTPPMNAGSTARPEKAQTVPPSYPQNKPAKKPKKKKSKKDKDKQQHQLHKSQDFSIPANSVEPDTSAFDQNLTTQSAVAAMDLGSLQGSAAIAEALENGDTLRAKTTPNLLLKQLLRGPPVCTANSVQAGVVTQTGGENVMPNTSANLSGIQHTLAHQGTESHLPPAHPTMAGVQGLPSSAILSETPDGSVVLDDDANIKLTPEQQKQLEMVEKLPYVKKNGKPAENDHQILIEIHKKGKYSSNSKKNKEKETDSHKKKHKDKKKKKRKKGEEKKPASLDDVMAALKSLPILQLCEPVIESNISVCSLFGMPANGGHRLRGSYGNAMLEGVADFYGSLVNGPLGKKEMANGPSSLTEDEKKKISKKGVQALTVKSSEVTVMTGDEIMQEMQSHQRTITRTINHAYTGRGNHSSPLFALSAASSEAGSAPSQRSGGRTPASAGEIAPSSSPELEEDEPLETAKMRGLRLITRNATEIAMMARADSPNIPIIKPTPRKGKPAVGTGNTVKVSLTLGSSMNKNIKELLGSISKLLRVIEPKTYEVIQGSGEKECFGVKEATEAIKPVVSGIDQPTPEVTAPVPMEVDKKPATSPKPQDLTGARFCKHCDVMIVGEGIHKVTGPSADSSHTFCSTVCYMQYTISQRTQSQQAKDTVTKVLDTQNTDGDNMTPPPNVNVPMSGSLPTSPLPSALSPHTSRASPVVPSVVPPVASPPPVNSSPPITNTTTTTSISPEVPVSVAHPPVKVVLPRVDQKEQQKETIKEDARTKVGIRRKTSPGDENMPQPKKIKMRRWRKWSITLSPSKRHRPPEEEDIDELMRKLGTSLQPGSTLEDKRVCILCSGVGDGDTDGTARLLNVDVGIWIHLNCALWSDSVYETLNGALMNVMNCIKQGKSCKCCYCCKAGATVSCHKQRCYNVYHFGCAIQDHCMFFKDKTMLCPLHAPSKPTENTLETHVVFRRVYVSRDEHRQVASIMQQTERTHTLRVGSLIFHSLGQLLPHQMQTFHSSTAIFPVGYETVRLYWSMRFTNKRCQYYCSIKEESGRPCFIIKVVEQGHEDLLLQDKTPKAVWDQVLEHIAKLRQEADMINLFPYYLTGEDLFGFTEPAIQRVLESLPGIEMIQNYSFRYGRSPHIDLPLAVNPTGCARTEPKRQDRFRPHLLLTSTIPSRSKSCLSEGDYGPLYNKLFVHTKSSQYKKLKTDWKQYVYLAKSNIQGLGMFAATEIEKHTMVIEYVGTLIRNETSNLREKNYNAANRGIYMFRIDNDTVCDATISGNAARYINHSCDPNCVAEVVTFGPDTKKIIIFSNRKLHKGEELTYDYKFDIEDDRQKKIPCTCKAPNCRKWMN